MIRLLLADDQALVRAGFRVLLDTAADMTVVAEAANGGEAVALARKHHPDVALIDLRMPEVDGLTAIRRITSDPALQSVRVLALTVFDDDETVFAALRAGASGFMVKDAEPDELLQAVRVIARGDALLAPSVTRAVISAFAERPGPARPQGQRLAGPQARAAHVATLTKREREVVCLVADGLSNEEIARKLMVSPLTVKTHVSHAMIKLAARDRAQLVVIAYESGLTAPGRD
jgi:DNA-binding NarL/FixJ family response regulator